jgi:hypothetical protein
VSQRSWRWLLILAAVLNAVVVYAPSAPGAPGLPLIDKVVHFAIFAAVAFAGRRAGVPGALLLGVLLVHAASSEVLQEVLLPERSGDVWDGVADAVGCGAGWLAAGVGAARRGSMGPVTGTSASTARQPSP